MKIYIIMFASCQRLFRAVINTRGSLPDKSRGPEGKRPPRVVTDAPAEKERPPVCRAVIPIEAALETL